MNENITIITDNKIAIRDIYSIKFKAKNEIGK
jgi:hypothetical protein